MQQFSATSHVALSMVGIRKWHIWHHLAYLNTLGWKSADKVAQKAPTSKLLSINLLRIFNTAVKVALE